MTTPKASEVREVRRIGPDTPDNSMVICPQCTSQFQAICCDDQKYRRELEAERNTAQAALAAAQDEIARREADAKSMGEAWARDQAALAAMTKERDELQDRWESAERWKLCMTGLQIQHVADLIDGDNETEVLIQYAEERKDIETGETMPAGLYASLVDLPDEGCLYLPPDAEAALTTKDSDKQGEA